VFRRPPRDDPPSPAYPIPQPAYVFALNYATIFFNTTRLSPVCVCVPFNTRILPSAYVCVLAYVSILPSTCVFFLVNTSILPSVCVFVFLLFMLHTSTLPVCSLNVCCIPLLGFSNVYHSITCTVKQKHKQFEGCFDMQALRKMCTCK
jgi:hypothetical protein